MFGYIQPLIPELKVKDKDLYRAFYCGLCRSLGKYGATCRAALTFDATFAALLLTGAVPEAAPPVYKPRGCIVHPARGKTPAAEGGDIFDFCAAVGIMLTKYKLMDDSHDGRPMRRCLIPVFYGGAKKAAKKYPEAAEVLKNGMAELAGLEERRSEDTDGAPVLFGNMLADIICSYKGVTDEVRPMIAGLCRAIGGYVYVIDAWDDRAEDKKRGCYNIFNNMEENPPEGAEGDALHDTACAMTDMYINAAALAYDLLDIKHCKPVLDNIIYLGLRSVADHVLNGKEGEE